MVQSARNRLKYISPPEFKLEDDDGRSFQEILLDIAKYEDDELVQNALLLLMRFYSDEDTLFSKAAQTQLLCTKRSIDAYKEVEEKLPILQHQMSLRSDNNERIVKILQSFTQLCGGEKGEPNQRNQTILCSFGRHRL